VGGKKVCPKLARQSSNKLKKKKRAARIRGRKQSRGRFLRKLRTGKGKATQKKGKTPDVLGSFAKVRPKKCEKRKKKSVKTTGGFRSHSKD